MTKGKKHILVAVAGESPAIITETLWHLTQVEKAPVTEIHVLTTTLGKGIITRQILAKKEGAFPRFCREYGFEARSIRFSKDTVQVLTDSAGKPLVDIRSDADNLAAADGIAAAVRDLADPERHVLHCSIAGGRKTMTVYMAFALQLFGGPEDTLCHVLVNPELESSRDFYYIPKVKKDVRYTYWDKEAKAEKRFPASQARIQVAKVPFVRLRHQLGVMFPGRDLPFSEMVRCAQFELESPVLTVRVKDHALDVAGQTVRLSEGSINLYLFFVNQKRKHCLKDNKDCHNCTACFVPLDEARYIDESIAHEIASYGDSDPRQIDYDAKEMMASFEVSTDVFMRRIREGLEKALGKGAAYEMCCVLPSRPGGKRTPHGIRMHRDRIRLDTD